jgi:hypothetical protein
MRIHITTNAPHKAAREIMQHMESYGGEWIVNAVEDEGYIMAKAGTLAGKRLSRSLSPSLCGPFSTNTTVDEVEGRIRIARRISLGVKSDSSIREAKPKDDDWVSPTRRAEEMLQEGHVKIRDLVETIGITRNAAHKLMYRLVESKRARIVSQVPTGIGNGTVCTFGAVA